MIQTLLDYVRQSPLPILTTSSLNELDAAIFALLSYLPWDDIVPCFGSKQMISLKEASNEFLKKEHPSYTSNFRMKLDQKLLYALKNQTRFSQVFLSNYQNQIDFKREQQFSALVFSIQPSHHIIAFRGTDDSFAGWKEDFNMSFQTPVASQKEAVFYVEKIASELDGTLSLVGHSKGGNLAVYAASFSTREIQNRINQITNFDGPGFLKKILETPGYQAIEKRILTLIPQSSIVGMLLEHAEPYTVIHSYQLGLWQHDLYSWEVDQTHFVRLEQITNTSLFFNQTIHEWMSHLTLKEREDFIDTLYRLFLATNVKTTDDFSAHWLIHTKTLISELSALSLPNKAFLLKTIQALFKIGKQNFLLSFKRNRENEKEQK